MLREWKSGHTVASTVCGPRRLVGWLLGAGPILLALAAVPQASADELTARGNTGSSTVYRGSCKYGVFGPRGILTVGAESPTVSGANTKKGTRRERTYVRHRVEVVDVARDYATLQSSGWSSYIPVRQNQSRTWPGKTYFNMDWTGAYDTDILIEWHTRTRRVGWRWERVSAFNYFDQYNTGPYGPLSYCYRY